MTVWKTFAEGTSLENFALTTEDRELPKGTPVRFVLDLRVPIGEAFDLAGVEMLFSSKMPEGLILTDVHSNGAWQAIIEAESDPVFLAAIPIAVAVKWALLTIAAGLALAFVISSIRGEAPFSAVADITKYLFWGALVAGGVVVFKILSDKGYIASKSSYRRQ